MAFCALQAPLADDHSAFACVRGYWARAPYRAPHVTFHTRVLRATDEIEGERATRGKGRREVVDLLFFSCCRGRSLARSLVPPSRSVGHFTLGRSFGEAHCAQTDRASERACAMRIAARVRSLHLSSLPSLGSLGGELAMLSQWRGARAVVRPAERNERRRRDDGRGSETNGRTHNKVSE